MFTNLVNRAVTKFVRIVKKIPSEPPDVYLGKIPVSRTQPVFFVAEIGVNHNGGMEIAKKLIDIASEAGAQAVKFQKRTIPMVYSAEELAKPRAVPRDLLENAIKREALPKESVERLIKSDFQDSTDGDLKYAREFNEAEYRELFSYANQKGLLCFASPWDEESLDFLEKLDPPCHKIASAMLTNAGLLRKVKQTGRPVILSTGMSTMEQVRKALSILGTRNLILLHTVSTYPAEEKDLNLRTIIKFRKFFPAVQVGYSGHEKGIVASVAAATIGARLIERHITLDKKMFGGDQAASLEPQEFVELVKAVRAMSAATGTGVKTVLEAEIPIIKMLRKTQDF
ncbi:MAG: N-acetylneuraminate synthase family protein [Patescibacteria group bacterium]